jgi:hypothetical protein
MSEERKKVLEMLAAGKITADEAEKLLDKLSNNASNETPGTETSPASAATGTQNISASSWINPATRRSMCGYLFPSSVQGEVFSP